jgi:hypothetical protein
MKSCLKMRNFKRTMAAAAGLVTLLFFQNCADQKFTDVTDTIVTNTGGPNCREVLNSITTPIEMVFVVDVSGSNKEINKGPGSDPDKAIRAGSISAFFNQYKTKTNFSWSLASFAKDSATTLTANSNAAAMQTAIDDLLDTSDSGGTPYGAALDRAKSFIQNDPNPSPYKKYVVVFWSDGLPNPAMSDSALQDKTLEVINASPGKVSMNTVYYGPIDPEASGRLRMVAQTGGGNFLDTNLNGSGSVFNVSDLVVVPGEVCD